MAHHYVICPYCNEKFDRDTEPFVQINARRYAHKECADKYGEQKTQDELDLEKLEKYIMRLFGDNYINAKIRKQLRDYKKDYGYSYSGMLKSLIYWYEVKDEDIEKANHGIGIIPYIYDTARQYYYNLYLIKLSNEDRDINDFQQKEKIIEIFSPEIQRKKIRLFDLDEVENGEK
jgi:hypothetical protein